LRSFHADDKRAQKIRLPFVIAVGYRVGAPIAIKFRQWATQTLSEFVTKGFVMDDDRLKGGGTNYFDEWLKRVGCRLPGTIVVELREASLAIPLERCFQGW
jgi:hypothetical protein